MGDYFTIPHSYRLGLLGDMYRRGVTDALIRGCPESMTDEQQRVVMHVLESRRHYIDDELRELIESITDAETLAEIAGRVLAYHELDDVLRDIA